MSVEHIRKVLGYMQQRDSRQGVWCKNFNSHTHIAVAICRRALWEGLHLLAPSFKSWIIVYIVYVYGTYLSTALPYT